MVKMRVKSSKVNRLRGVIAEIKKYSASAGWNESAKYADGTPVAGIAAVQEYGSPKMKIPPRSFMRTTAANKTNEWRDLSTSIFTAVAQGTLDAKQAYGILGAKAAGDIKKTIAEISSPELSPVTLALRNLQDSGRQITGALVFAVKRAVALGLTGPGQLGYGGGASKKPLVDDGILINTLGHEVKER